jgi:hypothetical protein
VYSQVAQEVVVQVQFFDPMVFMADSIDVCYFTVVGADLLEEQEVRLEDLIIMHVLQHLR